MKHKSGKLFIVIYRLNPENNYGQLHTGPDAKVDVLNFWKKGLVQASQHPFNAWSRWMEYLDPHHLSISNLR